MTERKKVKTRKIYRSSITGEIVSREYAEANPETTQSETISITKTPASGESITENKVEEN